MKYLSECDIMVFDLHQGNPHDVHLAIDALKKYNFEDEKVLILISSLIRPLDHFTGTVAR